LLLLGTKEDQSFILAANGLLFASTARGDTSAKRIGWIIAGLAVLMAFVYFGLVRHALNPHVSYESLGFFNWTGPQGGAQASVGALLLSRIRYVLIILAPLAFLPCISRYGLFLIPGFVEILAAHQPVTILPGAHYSALLTGYALAGFVDGAARLAARKQLLAKGLVAAAALTSIYVAIFASPMEYWYYLYRRPNAHDASLDATLRQLPWDAAVGAEDEIFAHLGLDPNASINFAGQQWFVYDRGHYSERWHEVDEPAVGRALARRAYVITSDRDGIVVLKRSDLR
jgi:hypothetical protein